MTLKELVRPLPGVRTISLMRHLFAAGQRMVVIYSTNERTSGTAPHVRHRNFTPLVEARFPQWRLAEVTRGPNTERARADFFVYERT